MRAQDNVHQGGGFGGVNVSYNYLAAARAAAAVAQQMELHAVVRTAVKAPRLADWFSALQARAFPHQKRCLVRPLQRSCLRQTCPQGVGTSLLGSWAGL